jgi:hypothetical protein
VVTVQERAGIGTDIEIQTEIEIPALGGCDPARLAGHHAGLVGPHHACPQRPDYFVPEGLRIVAGLRQDGVTPQVTLRVLGTSVLIVVREAPADRPALRSLRL